MCFAFSSLSISCSNLPFSFTRRIDIMWLIYTWKSLEEKSHVLSSLANHLASQGEYYVAHIHMEKSRGQKSCLILSCKPFSFTRVISCGSYTYGKVQRAKVLSYPLQQSIQFRKDKYYVVHIHMEKSRGQKSHMGNFLINFLVIQSLSVL